MCPVERHLRSVQLAEVSFPHSVDDARPDAALNPGVADNNDFSESWSSSTIREGGRQMDSNSLSRKGFERWQDFSLKAEAVLSSGLPISNGVYVIRNETPFGRFVGDSDIVYIGSASGGSNLRERVLQYFNPGPTQIAIKRINGILHLRPGLKISYVLKPSADEADALESALLKEYDHQHGELPPANRND